MNDKRQQNVKIPWFLLILLAGVIILSLVPFRVLSERLTAGELRMVLASPDEIMEASIELNSYSRSADVVLELSDGRSVKATVPDAEEVMAELDADGVDYTISGIAESSFMDNIPYMIMMVMMFFFFVLVFLVMVLFFMLVVVAAVGMCFALLFLRCGPFYFADPAG